MKKTWLGMTAISILVVGFAGLTFFLSSSFYPKVYKGVVIEGVDVSGYNREEVVQLLSAWQAQYRNKSIVVQYSDTEFKVAASSIGLEVDVDATLDEVWNYGRSGAWWERLKIIKMGWEKGYPVTLAIKYDQDQLNSLIDHWKEEIDRPPRNAVINLWTGAIVPHEQGYTLEEGLLRTQLLETFKKSGNNAIILPITVIEPKITVDDLTSTGIHEIISSYTTTFNSGDVNRTDNIKLAALRANGTLLHPGTIFSFNEVVGPREKEYGFKEALEIVDGEFVPGIGGGICQVSSTLYNAVLLANLKIVERYNHSRPLSYVSLGRDATVAYNALDFKFINNTTEPLLIVAEVEGNKLVVGILGNSPLKETVEIKHENREKILPIVIKREDANLYLGETKIDQEGNPGYKITTVRLVWSKGRQISREVLSKDVYMGQDTIVKVGTKIPPSMEKIDKKQKLK